MTDLLNGKLGQGITAVLVPHADEVWTNSQDSFALRIIRQQMQAHSPIYALTDRPDKFGRSLQAVERTMKSCMVQNLLLWPRFREEVKNALQTAISPPVMTHVLQIPPSIHEVERKILLVIDAMLNELKKVKEINLKDISVKDAAHACFREKVAGRVDPVLKSVGSGVELLYKNMLKVRDLLDKVLRYDCVSFLIELEMILQKTDPSNPNESRVWFDQPIVHELKALAKARVFTVPPGQPKKNLADINLVLEQPPKFKEIRQILSEFVAGPCHGQDETIQGTEEPPRKKIRAQGDRTRSSRPYDDDAKSIAWRALVTVSDSRTARHVKDIIRSGINTRMLDYFQNYLTDYLGRLEGRHRGQWTSEAYAQHLIVNYIEKQHTSDRKYQMQHTVDVEVLENLN